MSISIKIKPDGTLAEYVPKKVFSALYYKQLVQKIDGKWIIPESKRSLVQNLEIVEDHKETDPQESIKINELTLSIGDLFNHSWGYDQTNYNFLVVVGFTKSKKSAYCRMVNARMIEEESGRGQDALLPENDPYGDTFRMKISTWKTEIRLRGSYPYLNDGLMKTGTRLATFWQVEKDKRYFETSAGWGH